MEVDLGIFIFNLAFCQVSIFFLLSYQSYNSRVSAPTFCEVHLFAFTIPPIIIFYPYMYNSSHDMFLNRMLTLLQKKCSASYMSQTNLKHVSFIKM